MPDLSALIAELKLLGVKRIELEFEPSATPAFKPVEPDLLDQILAPPPKADGTCIEPDCHN
jgi:hypothetical protein